MSLYDIIDIIWVWKNYSWAVSYSSYQELMQLLTLLSEAKAVPRTYDGWGIKVVCTRRQLPVNCSQGQGHIYVMYINACVHYIPKEVLSAPSVTKVCPSIHNSHEDACA